MWWCTTDFPPTFILFFFLPGQNLEAVRKCTRFWFSPSHTHTTHFTNTHSAYRKPGTRNHSCIYTRLTLRDAFLTQHTTSIHMFKGCVTEQTEADGAQVSCQRVSRLHTDRAWPLRSSLSPCFTGQHCAAVQERAIVGLLRKAVRTRRCSTAPDTRHKEGFHTPQALPSICSWLHFTIICFCSSFYNPWRKVLAAPEMVGHQKRWYNRCENKA